MAVTMTFPYGSANPLVMDEVVVNITLDEELAGPLRPSAIESFEDVYSDAVDFFVELVSPLGH